MRLLLDSHVLLWWLQDHERLRPVREMIIEAPAVYVSAATIWELGIKARLGRLTLPVDLVGLLPANRFEPLPISLEHAQLAASLPPLHADPFDRMLVAQAQAQGLTLLTRDLQVAGYAVSQIKV